MNENITRIALAQINTTVGDIEGNAQKIITYIRTAYEQNADMIIFPELTITGYPPEDLLLKESFINNSLSCLAKIKDITDDIVVIIGCLDRKNKLLFNSAAILHNHKIIDIYHKMLLPNYGVFDEKRYFFPGEKTVAYEFKNIIFGVNICEDIWHENGPAQYQVKNENASLITVLNSSPFHAGKGRQRKELLISRAKTLKAHIAYVNLVGGQDELVFDGQSMIVSPEGEILYIGKQFEEELAVIDLTLSLNVNKNAIVIPASNHKKNKKIINTPHNGPIEQISSMEEIYKALITGTRDYIHKNGFNKVALGLSGGIDSALTAAIASDAIGHENVTGIFMPSRYSSYESENDAKALAENLKINYLTISIQNIYEIYLSELINNKIIKKSDNISITEENLQARIRGNILMALSNKFKWLILTTGNKSELSVGYATLYGDMAGGLSVLKDVFKIKVYQLVNYRNNISNVIPENVIKKAPTAELRPDQKDTDSLPPYNILDPILQAYIEEDKKIDEIIKSGFEDIIVHKVINLVDNSEYKRRQAPPGIKITPRAFGKDRRIPITNKFKP